LTSGKLIGIDQDINAINKAKEVLKDYLDKVILVHDNYVNIERVLRDLNIDGLTGFYLILEFLHISWMKMKEAFLITRMPVWI